jgi:acyl-coenzyme A thioesterase PaaI-like protein
LSDVGGISDFGISAGVPSRAEAAAPHPHDPRFELASAVRRITSAMVGANLTDDVINSAAARLADLADDLEHKAAPGRRRRYQPDPSGHPQEFFPTSPVIGFANPISPPVAVESAEGGLEGTAWFDYQYEGPPTCVHGGVIAMVFDEILGAANIAAGHPGMTGTLTIRYFKPTPLRTPLRLEARCEGQQGRKITTRGAIYHDDVLTAEAEGIFIQLIPERFMKMVSQTAEATDVLEQVRADAVRLGLAPAPDAG